MVEEILTSTSHVGIVVLSRGGDTIEKYYGFVFRVFRPWKMWMQPAFSHLRDRNPAKSLQHGKNGIKQ